MASPHHGSSTLEKLSSHLPENTNLKVDDERSLLEPGFQCMYCERSLASQVHKLPRHHDEKYFLLHSLCATCATKITNKAKNSTEPDQVYHNYIKEICNQQTIDYDALKESVPGRSLLFVLPQNKKRRRESASREKQQSRSEENDRSESLERKLKDLQEVHRKYRHNMDEKTEGKIALLLEHSDEVTRPMVDNVLEHVGNLLMRIRVHSRAYYPSFANLILEEAMENLDDVPESVSDEELSQEEARSLRTAIRTALERKTPRRKLYNFLMQSFS